MIQSWNLFDSNDEILDHKLVFDNYMQDNFIKRPLMSNPPERENSSVSKNVSSAIAPSSSVVVSPVDTHLRDLVNTADFNDSSEGAS